jgi:hypothetical protein
MIMYPCERAAKVPRTPLKAVPIMLSNTRSQASSSPAGPATTSPTRQKKKGISLVKGPVRLIGLALLAYGISALIFGGHGFVQHVPSGAVHRDQRL